MRSGCIPSRGAQLGELGDSCTGTLSCPDFGPHLHFALYRDPSGCSGATGPYAGNSTVPEPFDTYEDLAAGLDLVSHNDGAPLPTCDPLPPEGGILDDLGPCFTRGGTATYWHSESAGWDGHLIWTIATSAAAASWLRRRRHPSTVSPNRRAQ
jgi:hypothetical protein